MLKKIEFALELITAWFGALIFSLGVGSILFAGLRMADIRLPILAFPAVLVLSGLACIFWRFFFISFAIPIIAAFLDEFEFESRDLLMYLLLLASLPTLIFFALRPDLLLLGAAGTAGFTAFSAWSIRRDKQSVWPNP